MRAAWRWLLLLVLALLALQIFFIARIALMRIVNPESTAFQRSAAWQIVREKNALPWSQQWVDYDNISNHLKRAIITSEDDGFVNHDGVDWDAIEKAWAKNAKAQERAADPKKSKRPPKIIGGSTITQQLSKNLFLSGERTLVRKGQEFLITFAVEALLSKQRIFEIYLNNVEWGEGIYGAEAAAQHYFKKPAAKLLPLEAARLAAMLPRPKYFEKLRKSAYLNGRANSIANRMGQALLPNEGD